MSPGILCTITEIFGRIKFRRMTDKAIDLVNKLQSVKYILAYIGKENFSL